MSKYFYCIHLSSLLIQVLSPHPPACLNAHCKSSLSLAILKSKGGEKFEGLDWFTENIADILAETLVLLFGSCTHLLCEVLTLFICFVNRQGLELWWVLIPNPTHFCFAVLGNCVGIVSGVLQKSGFMCIR